VILKQPACQAPLAILNQGSSSRVVDVGRSYRCLN